MKFSSVLQGSPWVLTGAVLAGSLFMHSHHQLCHKIPKHTHGLYGISGSFLGHIPVLEMFFVVVALKSRVFSWMVSISSCAHGLGEVAPWKAFYGAGKDVVAVRGPLSTWDLSPFNQLGNDPPWNQTLTQWEEELWTQGKVPRQKAQAGTPAKARASATSFLFPLHQQHSCCPQTTGFDHEQQSIRKSRLVAKQFGASEWESTSRKWLRAPHLKSEAPRVRGLWWNSKSLLWLLNEDWCDCEFLISGPQTFLLPWSGFLLYWVRKARERDFSGLCKWSVIKQTVPTSQPGGLTMWRSSGSSYPRDAQPEGSLWSAQRKWWLSCMEGLTEGTGSVRAEHLEGSPSWTSRGSSNTGAPGASDEFISPEAFWMLVTLPVTVGLEPDDL